VKVVLPTSVAGIASGITLAIARVIGETAPLLIVAGTTTAVNLNPFEEGRMATLPVFSYYSYSLPGVPREPYLDRAWAAALLLILIVMTLNLVGRVIARVFAPKTR
jgi:phosphate transport system permease protein